MFTSTDKYCGRDLQAVSRRQSVCKLAIQSNASQRIARALAHDYRLVAVSIDAMLRQEHEVHAPRAGDDSTIHALRDVCSRCGRAGLGIIGRNGAGKTTAQVICASPADFRKVRVASRRLADRAWRGFPPD